MGVSCVNALSKYLKVNVYRDGKVYEQEYSRGIPQYAVKEIGTTDKRGTVVEFLPDDEVFTVSVYEYQTLASRLRELAFLNKGIELTITDFRQKDEQGKTPGNRGFDSPAARCGWLSFGIYS